MSGVKLIIQIPCYNEEKTLRETLEDLPIAIPGVDTIEYLIIDDGSHDRTADVAREFGVHHIVQFPANRGLTFGFMAGLDASLRAGADIIVNTDADNQYVGADIPKLVEPILRGEADIVVGDRQTDTIEHFSGNKKRLQKLGSWVVRQASSTNVSDATSGFRAIRRAAALEMFVVNKFTYTLETLIQAGHRRRHIVNVPIRTNPPTRKSRLFRGMYQYVRKAGSTIIRVYTMYRPLRTFLTLASIMFFLALAVSLRFLWFYFQNQGDGHVQSLILAAILFNGAFVSVLIGVVGDISGANRDMLTEMLGRVRSLDYTLRPSVDEQSALAGVEHRTDAAD